MPEARFSPRSAPDPVEAHRVEGVPLVDRPGEHGARPARTEGQGREEQRVQGGRVLLGDRHVRSEDLELDRDLRGRRVGDGVGKVKRRRRLGRLENEHPEELGQRPGAGGAGAHRDTDPLRVLPDGVAGFRDRLRARDQGELAPAVEAARLHRGDLGLGRESLVARGVGRLHVGPARGVERSDRVFAGRQSAIELGGAAAERRDRAGPGDEAAAGHHRAPV